MNLRDRMSGLFWLGISVFVCVEGLKTGIGTFGSPAPGFLPFWLGAVLGIFSMILLVKSVMKREAGGEIIRLWKGLQWSKVVWVTASLSVYAILLPILGYLLATFGLMTVLFGMLEKSRHWIHAVSALLTVLASYVIFHVWLQVQLPKGVLNF